MSNVVYLCYVPLHRFSFEVCLGQAWMFLEETHGTKQHKFQKSRGWATDSRVFVFLFSHESSPVHYHNAGLIHSKTERRCIHPRETRPNSHHSQTATAARRLLEFPHGVTHTCISAMHARTDETSASICPVASLPQNIRSRGHVRVI